MNKNPIQETVLKDQDSTTCLGKFPDRDNYNTKR